MERQDSLPESGQDSPNRFTDNGAPSASYAGSDQSAGSFKPVEFTGSAGEYFPIWISNLLLSIITIGIYSAWAKVRRVSYFYNNTRFEGTGLVYHAKPMTILIGRIIAVVVLIAINLLSALPFVALALLPVMFFAVPWIINRSMRFQARMTSWRNVRFMWHGSYGKTLLLFMVGPIVSVMSLGLLAPLVSKHSYAYIADRHSFGTTAFSSHAKTGQYYKAFFWGAFLPYVIITLVLAGIFSISGLGEAAMRASQAAGAGLGNDPFIFRMMGIIYSSAFALFIATSIYGVMARNVLISALELGDKVEFQSTLHPGRVLWIMLSNLLAVIFTLGLMTPWAHTRLYDYMCSQTHYKVTGDLGAFVDEQTANIGAFGEEFADLEGFDVGV